MATEQNIREGAGTLVSVAGIVRDAVTSDPLAGAHVYYYDEQGAAQGQATASDGTFGLVVPVGVTLRSTFVGYGQQQQQVDAAGVFNFDLQPGVDIGEVEIVGDAPGVPTGVVAFGLLATLFALMTGDRSNGTL